MSSSVIASKSKCHEVDVNNLHRVLSSVLGPMTGLNSVQKHVPERVWRATMPYKRAFLQALFTGDGVVAPAPQHHPGLVLDLQRRARP